MHTLPLPEVTETNSIAKPGTGSLETSDARSSRAAQAATWQGRPLANPTTEIKNSIFAVSQSKSQVAGRTSADATFRLPRLSPQQLQFLLRVVPPALTSEWTYLVPACITVAQAILESATSAGWGSSSLFRLANNPFGIKYAHFGRSPEAGEHTHSTHSQRPATSDATSDPATSNTEASAASSGTADYGHFDARTWEIVNGNKQVVMAEFQRFPDLTTAFQAHALLLNSPRYRTARDVRHDWKKFAERLGPKTSPLDAEHCGYSTNPSYSAELIKLVELYHLDDAHTMQFYATGK